MTTQSPSVIAAPIIESPVTLSMNRSPSPTSSKGSGNASSADSSAGTGLPAAIRPTIGTLVASLARVRRGAGAAWLAPQMALALQGGKLMFDTGGAGQADRPADLAHGRRVPALLHPVVDEPENRSLPRGERPVGAGA